MIDVVAALLWRGERFLICKRPEGKARALLWEFVGGKVEKGETEREALARECREELGVEIVAHDEYASVLHRYPDVTVRLKLFNAEIVSGEIELLEHADMRWITREEIPFFDFCPADEEILLKLLGEREFPFFGSEKTNAVRPINAVYNRVYTPKGLYALLSKAWCVYTCAPRLRDEWSENNKTCGQCTISSFLAQDIFGGKVKGVLLPSGNYHCFNEIDGVVFDLTSEQFGEEKLNYDDCRDLVREKQLYGEKLERYAYLKRKVLEYLSVSP